MSRFEAMFLIVGLLGGMAAYVAVGFLGGMAFLGGAFWAGWLAPTLVDLEHRND